MYQGQQELIKQGIEWLKLNQDALIALYAKTVRGLPNNFFARLDEPALLTFAATNIKGIVGRLEGITISAERTEQNLFGFFEQGVSLTDLHKVIEAASLSFKTYVERELANQPEIAVLLIDRVMYIRQAYATATSLAMVKFQSKKP